MTIKVVVYRRSDNGHFTTKEYAKRHPKTTEREVVKKNDPKK
jgi:hypothetical protein